ncbi:hypothetical protein VTK56DRAFT_9156 [Thermocarpiscus australiensis]
MMIPPKEDRGLFRSISLHLRFTDYVLPIDTGTHSLRDVKVSCIESVVSAHDRGEWVADLDILSALSSRLQHRVTAVCDHAMTSSALEYAVRENQRLTTIDYLNELIDP